MQIYVGNLSPSVSEEDIRTAFKAFGKVSFVNIVRNRQTRSSAGYGFVDMPELPEAEAAIAGLHATDMKGQSLAVCGAQAINANRNL